MNILTLIYKKLNKNKILEYTMPHKQSTKKQKAQQQKFKKAVILAKKRQKSHPNEKWSDSIKKAFHELK